MGNKIVLEYLLFIYIYRYYTILFCKNILLLYHSVWLLYSQTLFSYPFDKVVS